MKLCFIGFWYLGQFECRSQSKQIFDPSNRFKNECYQYYKILVLFNWIGEIMKRI